MSAKQFVPIAFLILLLFSIASFANDAELSVAKVREGILSPGKQQSFVVSLNAGDFAQIKLDPRGKELVVIAYDPSGSKFRGTRLGQTRASSTSLRIVRARTGLRLLPATRLSREPLRSHSRRSSR